MGIQAASAKGRGAGGEDQCGEREGARARARARVSRRISNAVG